MHINSHLSLLRQRLKAIGRVLVAVVSSLALTWAGLPSGALATTTNPVPSAMVSFTFDDSLQSTFTNAAPILSQSGISGTDYVITGCVGMTTVPNTCRADTGRAYMTWAQVQSLQNTSGWEIGSHTVDHDCLASNAQQDRGDCQTATLTTAQVDAELSGSKSALAAQGINATDFAPPYGDFNNSVLAEIAKYYASMRQFKNEADNANVWPGSDYYLQDITAEEGLTPVSTIEADINNAIANKQWLVLTFHDIVPTPSTDPNEFQYGTAELQQIAAYVQSKVQAGQITTGHVNQGLVTSTSNLLPNSNFASGISAGWTTDSPSTITADAGGNGSYPDPSHSIKLTSSSATGHLFSPKVPVTTGTNYVIKNFLNLQAITSGQVGFYIDEYNANGQWISGQWKTQEVNPFVEDLNVSYTPSSVQVSQASLQVIVAGNAGISAFYANPQWFATQASTPANMMPNYNFAAGISGGWTTDDPTDVTADSAGNGAPDNPTFSASFNSRATSANSHLFSPKIPVVTTTTYNVSSWVNIKQLTNSTVGFYIDEYNSSGQWISGQYMASDSNPGAQTVGFTYKPTSSSVATASLQFIAVGGSGLHSYLDDVFWYPSGP